MAARIDPSKDDFECIRCRRNKADLPPGLFRVTDEGVICGDCLTADEDFPSVKREAKELAEAVGFFDAEWLPIGPLAYLLTLTDGNIHAVVYWADREDLMVQGPNGYDGDGLVRYTAPEGTHKGGQWYLAPNRAAKDHIGLGFTDRADVKEAVEAATAIMSAAMKDMEEH